MSDSRHESERDFAGDGWVPARQSMTEVMGNKLIAATLVNAIAANRPGVFPDADAVYGAYIELYGRLNREGDGGPSPLQSVEHMPGHGRGGSDHPAPLQLKTVLAGESG